MVSIRPRFEVADVIRLHGETFLRTHATTLRQRQVLFRLAACRTPQLGGHLEVCPSCPEVVVIAYNSCRDRHCPKCQGRERAEWVERSLARILPVSHFHVVFTVPDGLRPLFLRQPRPLYNLLFQACAQALLELTADPRFLGAFPGFLLVLHTWAQNLAFHPHLHGIVTPGGLAPDDSAWLPSRPTFLVPVKALAKRFRRLFRAGLRRLGLDLPPRCPKRWVVYAKRPLRGPAPLFRYLGRYTHRVGLANHRLVAVGPESVTFTVRARNPATGSRRVTLTGPEFLRRYLLHVLPKGFVRIRHYGLYTSTHRASRLARARQLLAPSPTPTTAQPQTVPPRTCPRCARPLVHFSLLRPLRLVRAAPSPSRAPPHVA